jgi:hypothetical protein
LWTSISGSRKRRPRWRKSTEAAPASGGAPRLGITISELADSMGIKANYLYRVLPALEADGKVKKRKKGWHPA